MLFSKHLQNIFARLFLNMFINIVNVRGLFIFDVFYNLYLNSNKKLLSNETI